MFRIKVAESAEKDIRGAADYIERELQNSSAAQRLLRNFGHAVLSLSEMPLRHGLVKDTFLAAKGVRSLPVDNYLLFYTVSEDEKKIIVRRFLYNQREWAKQLFEDNLDA